MDIITRTIDSKRYKVICLNIKTHEVSEANCSLTGKELTGDRLLAELKKKYDTDEVKLVSVIQTLTVSKLYAMSVDAFMKEAYVFDNIDDLREQNKERKLF